jgi:hypothetical protein
VADESDALAFDVTGRDRPSDDDAGGPLAGDPSWDGVGATE